jgi:hypothetical protein
MSRKGLIRHAEIVVNTGAMTYDKFKRLWSDPKTLFWLYLVISIGVSVHKYLCCDPTNYKTFATSFWELVRGVDIYFPVPKIWDYKYSPSFSVLFAPMAVLPVFFGALIWNLINALVLYTGIIKLKIEQRAKTFILWFLIFEYITSLQNFQSNILIAGLTLCTLNLLDDEKPFWASFSVVISFFIKIFGAASGLLFFLYPNKKNFILSGLAWGLIIAALPLIFVSPSWLIHLYASWYRTMSMDLSGSLGYSVMMLVNKITPVSKTYIQLVGLVILVLPLILSHKSFSEYKNRLIYTASIMIWVVIFNHKAESSTFIIAATGAALWYVNSHKTLLNKILIVGVFVFTTLSYTDLPAKILVKFCDLPTIKVIPCILVWIKVQFDLLYCVKIPVDPSSVKRRV